MDHPRLFKVAPDAIALTARWEYPDGWTLAVAVHRSGVSDRSTVSERYERLSAEELADVVCEVVHGALKGVSG